VDERQRRRGVLAAALLNTFGSPVELLIGKSVWLPWWPPLSSAAVGAVTAALVLLIGRRRPLGLWWISLLFVVNTVAIVGALWITSGYYAASRGYWIPFQANKLGMLAAAIVAPAIAAGAISIGLFGGTALVRIARFDDEVRARLPIGEPFALLVFAGFALALLVYRVRALALEREAARAHAESDILAATALRFLAIRDLANTPIQTIDLNGKLARRQAPELAPLLDRIDRAVARLRELNDLLRAYDEKVDWKPGAESFAAATRLAERR
jgi:hypothetical protein